MGKPSISMGFENRTTCCMCPPPFLSPPLRPNPFALLSIREPIASRGNDGCKPSRTCFPILRKNTGCSLAERTREEDGRKRGVCFEKYKPPVFFFLLRLTQQFPALMSAVLARTNKSRVPTTAWLCILRHDSAMVNNLGYVGLVWISLANLLKCRWCIVFE